jgi:hypothetical protein
MPHSQNIINAVSMHQPTKGLFFKKPEIENKNIYQYKFGCCKSTFRYFCLIKDEKKIFDKLEYMMKRVISFENMANLSKTTVLLKTLLLEDYQSKTLDLLNIPRLENFTDINEYLLKMDVENLVDMKIMKLFEDIPKKEEH